MSFFAGVFSLSNPRVQDQINALEEAVDLPPDFVVSRYTGSHLHLLHGDLGVLPEKGWRITPSAVGAVGGSLLFGVPARKCEDAQQPELSEGMASLIDGRIGDLCNANGTFALCVYDRKAHRLTLAADSIGARPIYYVESSGFLFFATSMEVMRRLAVVPKTFDLAAYIEEEALCYPLGARTMFKEVRVVVASEAIVVEDGEIRVTKYHDWAKTPLANESVDELAENCRLALRQAVACRSTAGVRQRCLLSGGLDSRVLAAELIDLGHEVEAFNLAPAGFQDQVYAQGFAKAAGISLSSIPWSEEPTLSAGESTATMLAKAVSQVSQAAPGIVFSGDGGGETFGFLLMNAESGELLNKGNPQAAIEHYLSKYKVSPRLFHPQAYAQLSTVVTDRMTAELADIGAKLGEKALQVLVLTNDLRCHLHEYFNRLTKTRVELLLPFYDRRVITSVLRIPPPLTPLMNHAFYHRMLRFLPPVIGRVPWQTYRGHEACPIEDRSPPPDQWSRKSMVGDALAKRCFRMALSPGFAPVLQRPVVVAAAIMHLARRRDYTYLFKSCVNINARCGENRAWVLRDDGPVARPTYAEERVTV